MREKLPPAPLIRVSVVFHAADVEAYHKAGMLPNRCSNAVARAFDRLREGQGTLGFGTDAEEK